MYSTTGGLYPMNTSMSNWKKFSTVWISGKFRMSFHMLVAMANQLSKCSLLVQAKGSSNILQIILVCIMLKVWDGEIMLENPNAIVAVEVGRSNDSNAMGRERDTHRESDNSQKVRHTIVALKEIADKAWELVNSRDKWLNNGEWMGWNQ